VIAAIPYPSEIALAWAEAFRPIEKILPSLFAERELILPASSNAEPGKLRLTAMQKGIVDTFADPNVRVIALMLAAQTGKSTILNSIFSYTAAVNPGPCLLVQPTDGHATSYVRERLDPLINASPVLRNIIGDGKRGGSGDSLSFKSFPGGFLAIASSYKTEDLAARAVRVVLADEIDRFHAGGPEGDPLLLALRRQHTFRDRKTVLASTPTRPTDSRIAAWYERGDRRKFMCPCPQCKEYAPLDFDNVEWAKGAPDKAALVCEACGYPANEADRQRMIELGKWEPTAIGEAGVVSFHANALCSRFTSLAEVAAEHEAANTDAKKRVFYQTTLAQPYSGDESIELDAAELQSKARAVSEPLPAEIEYITAAVDVQADRVELQWCGHGEGRTWLLDHSKIYFETAALAGWSALDQALGRTFKTASGHTASFSIAVIDSGYNTTQVTAFVETQQRKSRRVLAIKGKSGFDRPTITPGSRSKYSRARPYIIGTDPTRLGVVRRLALESPDLDGGIYIASHLSVEVFEQLTAERLMTTYRKGYAKQEWEVDRGARNEALDCLVYNAAAATLCTQMPRQAAQTQAPQKSIADIAARLNQASNSTH
jgi:phage terminase large subunit GpA-like protein